MEYVVKRSGKAMNSGCETGNCKSPTEATGNICSVYKIKLFFPRLEPKNQSIPSFIFVP